jgi:hypothetical protein
MNPHLLEISAWPWLERISRAEGHRVTLGDVPPERWDALAAGAFEFLFLMGVWRRSPLGREIALTHSGLVAEYNRVLPGWTAEDVVGSPYCIQAYEPDDRLGGWAGLDAARRELQTRGVRLVLDFVPNHTAFDHPWTASHPERYVLGTEDDYRAAPGEFRPVDSVRGRVYIACGRDPYFPPWTDVAQLNYFNPGTREAMRDVLRTIGEHCDGVRCDMAMLVVNEVFERTWRRLLRDNWPRPADEFWPVATSDVPGLLYLAEVYWDLERLMLDQGFDYAYDKRLIDALHEPGPALRIRDMLASETPPRDRLARFLENHDEARSAAVLEPGLTAAASLVATVPGMRFFFDGQLEGRRTKAPVQLGRWPDEPIDEAVRALYERVLRFGCEDVVQRGEWRLQKISAAGDHTSVHIVSYCWRLGGALAVVVANPSNWTAQAHVAIAEDLTDGTTFEFEDRLTGESYRWTRESLERTGLFVRLDAGRAHLFIVHALALGHEPHESLLEDLEE